MQIRLHLISTPWAPAVWPSSAIGALKAYVDRQFAGRVETFCYSAQLRIPLEAETGIWPGFFDALNAYKEYPYLLLFYKKFLSPKHGELSSKEWTTACRDITKAERFKEAPLTPDMLTRLESATDRYLDTVIGPNLCSDSLNVVGLTLNYNQTHASLYVEKYLQHRFSKHRFLFLYGGYHAAYIEGVRTLKRLGASGYSVTGEGEPKLSNVLEKLLASPEGADVHALDYGLGVVRVRDFPEQYKIPRAVLDGQIQDLGDLPLPNYDEFFADYEEQKKFHPFLKTSVRPPILLLEGSRGCFANCDFCGLNAQWAGFRKLSPQAVYERTKDLISKYKVPYVEFVDTVCDTWAEGFADLVIKNKDQLSFFMEMRVHHPERFWVKLALAGAAEIQLGFEAFSQPLLTKMNKGTKVIHNLLAQKILKELGVSNPGNVMCSHPKSTLEDVKETKRVLNATGHFGNLVFPVFYFKTDGPIFDLLTEKEKSNIRVRPRYPLKGSLKNFPGENLNELPRRLALPTETREAWARLHVWYSRSIRNPRGGRPQMTVTRLDGDRRRILEIRKGQRRQITLRGDEARVLDLCHEGLTFDRICDRLNWDAVRAKKAIQSLLRKKILLLVDQHHLSLPLRSREEVVEKYKGVIPYV